MAIDPRLVKWDDAPPAIDPRMVKWDDEGPPQPKRDLMQTAIDKLRGFRDIPQAGSQMLAHALPRSVVDATNKAIAYTNEVPVLGDVQKAIGIFPQSPEEYDAELASDEKQYQQRRQAASPASEPGIDWTRLAGNTIAAAPLAEVMPAIQGKMAAQIGKAALQGGVLAAGTQPVVDGGEFWKEKGAQAAVGAATSGVLTPAVAGVSRVLSPKVSPEVQRLVDEGITPTPGQAMGGVFNRAEEKAASIPLLGDAIRWGRDRATSQLNTAALNRSLSPIGEAVPKGLKGREAIEFAQGKLSGAYDDVLDKIGAITPDAQFANDLSSLSTLVQNVPKEMGDQFNRVIKNEIGGRIDANGVMTSEAMKSAESNLGQLARNYMSGADPDKRVLGTAFLEAQSTLRDMVARSSPQHAPTLKAINSAYAQFMRPLRASTALGAEGGEFTGAQLQNAVKALDKSRNKGSFAKGKAMMQDLSEAGKNVLGNKVADSGTAGRLFMGAALGYGADQGYIDPRLAALGVGGAAAYSPTGQKAILALLTKRPEVSKKLGGLLLENSPRIGAMGAAAMPSLLD